MPDKFPCLPPVTCPGSDSPIINDSSEAPDQDVFISVDWGPPPSIQPLAPPPGIWHADGCFSECTSTISQQDADLCAQRLAMLCAMDTNPLLPPDAPACNDTTIGTAPCPDGNLFKWTINAGTFCGTSKTLANRQAASLAQAQARQHRFCLSDLSGTLPCKQPYKASITATGPVVTPCTWTIVAGALPPGLTLGGFSPNIDTTLGPTETIQGTPTQAGTFTFTLQCQGSDFSFMQKTYTLTVSGCAIPGLIHWSFDIPQFYVDDNLGIQIGALNMLAVPGKINNGVQFNSGVGFTISNLSVSLVPPAFPQLTPYTGTSISHAFWIKLDAGTGINPVEPVGLYIDAVDGHQYGIQLVIGAGGVTNNNPTFQVIRDPFSLGSVVVNSITLPIIWTFGQWVFLALIYDAPTGRLGYSINNGPITFSVTSFIIPSGQWNSVQLGLEIPFYATVTIDEYVIATKYELIAADIACLYNGGAGRAWPFANVPFPVGCQ